ncbi:protease II [Bifidobacterium animalis subsp. lactis BLC1]|uniref:Oligopeptidase B n=2 Tax=Bifidobacterium TaxID=1678 RepID=A0A806FZH1_BIFAN|nr:Oligopeptidase B [Bifidobacterium animalis subsp. lactis CNCM I-2494]AEN77091.2 protease II [Bifidobacterium animalis subsp. lactis BLC1]AGO52797.1 protease II [Bifidobacterium animalis subsp. lactis Bl12]AIA33347.1 peptidase S9 [Bifidobacterium animalis]AJC77030.1 peptidase S9 [Bifidobacterium animalis subsp. lactis KLDS2.0603]KOA44270.1 peptidase S9 [Bifidobacterium animalis subsp. lactis ATCC 27536]KOA49112.1 peptidase S9 [Bifidobacterium animalis subsp. lactis ATCC 27674]
MEVCGCPFLRKGGCAGIIFGLMTGMHVFPKPPEAKQVPSVRTFHGDTFTDPYEWMRDKDSADLKSYVAAENAYTSARTAGLANLRKTLFDEFRSHVQETDMSVPTRLDGYWYYARTQEGKQYGVQCRMPIRGEDDWTPPEINANDAPGVIPGEQVILDANTEAEGHDFFQIGGMDISKDGTWLLFGVDTSGDEQYDFRIRNLDTGEQLPDELDGLAAACFTPDGRYVFATLLDDAQRPYAIRRHKVGEPVERDVIVYEEHDEKFWVGIGLSFDERNLVIGTGSKTTTEVLMLPTATPEGEFQAFIPRQEGVEYDVSFAVFEHAGEHGEDLPVAIVYHNLANPNFEIDVIDMSAARPPYRIGDGVRIVQGSPYGSEDGEKVIAGASAMPVGTPYDDATNPQILRGVRGLAVEGIAMHEHFVALSYRANGLPKLAVMSKQQAAQDFLARRPWQFAEVNVPELDGDWDGASDDAAVNPPQLKDFEGSSARLYSIGTAGNPSYEAPRMRYMVTGYTRPGELREFDPRTGEDVLLKRANVLGSFDARDYVERRIWVQVRDGEQVPVSLVWRRDCVRGRMPMFVIGYGAYEISSDPAFSVSRLSMLDRGVLYVVPHVRGGGEMGRAWYEMGRRRNKKHTFEDFIDVTAAIQDCGLADRARTVANGGSAGGLLMGAVANMAPERFAGIEADVPFVDALTTILDPTLPLTVTEWDEWGDPLHDAETYRYMKTYTPYENAPAPGEGGARWPDGTPVTAFPKIFVTTSMNDSRVMVVEPLKWVARLQAAGLDAIIKIEAEAGHGGTSGRYAQWKQICYENAWVLAAMGIEE